jgi:hypothetical protein
MAEEDIIMVEIQKNQSWTLVPLNTEGMEESKAFEPIVMEGSYVKLSDFIDKDLNIALSNGSKRGVTGL